MNKDHHIQAILRWDRKSVYELRDAYRAFARSIRQEHEDINPLDETGGRFPSSELIQALSDAWDKVWPEGSWSTIDPDVLVQFTDALLIAEDLDGRILLADGDSDDTDWSFAVFDDIEDLVERYNVGPQIAHELRRCL